MIRFAFAAAIAAILMSPAQAETVTAGSLKISSAWARATPKGAQVGGGYLTITNTGSAPDRLVGGTSDVAGRVEVHEMSMDNGVMKMRMLSKGLEIKPGETVTLKPGGYHIMLMGLKHQLDKGQHFKATLNFEKAGKVNVDFAVESIAAQTPAGGHDMPGMKHDMPGMKMNH